MGGQGAELSIIFGNFVELCSRRESQPTRCRLYSELSQVHTSFVFAVGSVLVPDFRLFLEGEQPLDRELETLIYNAYSRKCSPPRDWTGTPLPTNVREVNLTLAYRSTVTSKFMSKYRWIQIMLPKTGLLRLPLLCVIVVGILFGRPFAFGQDSPGGQDSTQAIDRSVDAIKKIQKDYGDFLAKRKRIHEDYSKMEETLRKTEEDFQRINNDAMRQQIMAMQSSLQSSRIFDTLADLPNSVQEIRSTRQGRSQATRRNIIRYENDLVRAKAMADLDVAIRGVQLNQLDAASQATVRRRLETFQSGMKLQNEWIQWQSDWPKFLDRYWPHSDPERRFTKAELEARLEVLKDSDPEDFAAMITSAWLYERLGRWDEALETIEKVIAAETYFESTALCTKAFILYELGKEKDAKATLQLAIKMDTKSPYDRWIRARVAASRKQLPEAEKEWKALTTLKDFELESRRALALVGYARSGKSAADAKKSLKEAQLAYDLEPTHDWFSHLVLCLAFHVSKNEKEALKHLDKAEEKATDENLDLCKRIREAIVDGRTFEWDFQDGYGDRKPN